MKSLYKRVIILVLDSVGCGTQSDYRKFQSCKSNTLRSVYASAPGFKLPNLEKLGLLQLIENNKDSKSIIGVSGRMREQTPGNDTFAGIWEMVGVVFRGRFRNKKMGFPKRLIRQIEIKLGIKVIGNEYVSGFKALDKFYDEHKKRRGLILYLADDGVVLLAAHEKVISAQKLNMYGRELVSILKDHKISRVITRPFIGRKGNFIRTDNRRDYIALDNLEKESVLSSLRDNKISLITTEHLFNILGHPQGAHSIIRGNHTNRRLVPLIVDRLNKEKDRAVMLFCLQDFDMYGHRKDVKGYARSLHEFDTLLPKILKNLKSSDLLFITADHGCDPAVDLRGHTREFVPLLAYSSRLRHLTRRLGTRESFADLAQTICYNFELKPINQGKIIHEVF
ncbi:MAG: phosphopentomutase [Candidatus Colwellbacteria bacterium]|nr:phosphopentomutase [Candidatus Colwellbacteria bacterium]